MLIDKQDRAHFIQAFVNYLPDVAADRWGHTPALATQWVLCAFQFTGVWLYLENSSIFEPRDIKFSVYLHHSWDTVCISSCTIRYILSAMWRYSKFSQYLLTVCFFFFSPLFPHPPHTHLMALAASTALCSSEHTATLLQGFPTAEPSPSHWSSHEH